MAKNINPKETTSKQEGVTLMLSVLVLSAILAIALSLATVIFVEIRSSGDLIRTEPAYYAADAISEEALFKVKRHVPEGQFSYSSSINNVTLTNTQSSTSTPIAQVIVSKNSSTFANTTSHYKIYDKNCLGPVQGGSTTCQEAGSGYGRIKITVLDTGNSDTLKLYLCQFDARKSYDPTGTDSTAYTTIPCSDPDNFTDNYWILQAATLTSDPSNNTRNISLNPYMQQELIMFDGNSSPSGDIYVQLESFDQNDNAKGLPLAGQQAVDINAGSGGVVRKIRTIIPD